MNHKKLCDLLLNHHGCQIVTFVSVTKPQLKKDAPFDNLIKVAKINGLTHWNYENSVNNQRIREDKNPDFIALERSWGIRQNNSPFVTHKNNLYLEVKVQNPIQVSYFDGNKQIPNEQVEKYLVKSESKRQNLDKPVVLRDYNINNIKQFTMNGQSYFIN